MPDIPPKANRKRKNSFSPFLYRNSNAIERMFGRSRDFRRIATRRDRLAVDFLAATVSYWLRVRSLARAGRRTCRRQHTPS